MLAASRDGRVSGAIPVEGAVIHKIGRYEVDEELGRGAMGVVYRARDPQIGRTVAIKVILTGNASPQDLERYKQRFGREAQAAGRMSHPGIVTIHDIAEDETGQPYLVMEYIEGAPLDFLMVPPAPRPPLGEIFDIAIQVARALDYAHRNGVIHRDIKPANILVTPDGRAKIADFGIAKLAGTDMTQEGHSVGTPSFMSPEQFRGSGVDARSDIFSFGAVLYWMCTGEKPFVGESVTEVSFKIAFDAPAPALQRNAALPAGLDAVLLRCLAKQPSERYANCGELAADLEALKAGRPLPAQPPPPARPSSAPAMERTMPVSVSLPIANTSIAAASPGVSATGAFATTPARPEAGGPPAGGGSAAGTKEIPPPLAPAAFSLRRWPRAKLAAASALVILLIGAAYWLWPGAKGQPSPQNSAVNAGVSPAPQGSESRPAARSGGRGRSAAADSTLRIVCEHNFRSARLEVFSDEQPLLETTLRGREDDYGVMKIYEGRLETSKPIAAGHHTLRVRVSSRRDGYEEETEIGGTFAQNGSRTLAIEFGKGSALHVIDRKLSVSWR